MKGFLLTLLVLFAPMLVYADTDVIVTPAPNEIAAELSNLSFYALDLKNTADSVSGQTDQKVHFRMMGRGTSDNGTTFTDEIYFEIEAGQTADFFNASETDHDSYAAFYLNSSGTRQKYLEFSYSSTISVYRIQTPAIKFNRQSLVVADSGDGAAAAENLNIIYSYIEVTCEDNDGCDITVQETSATEGMPSTIVNVSTRTVNFADQAGVLNIAGAAAMGVSDTLSLIYQGDQWVETSRSDN